MGKEKPRATNYCPSCGTQVPTYRTERDERTEIRCSYCGLPLGLTKTVQPGSGGCVAVVDDDNAFRTLLADLLTQEGLAEEVLSCDSGPSFLTHLTQRFRLEQSVQLAILDIVMTPLDGVAAALAMRALERGFDRGTPIPVLFFSGAQATEALRNAMARCAPAYHLNKGADITRDRLAARIRDIFGQVLSAGGETGGPA